MQTNNRILDDMARLAGSATGLASGMRTEIEALIKARMRALMGEMEIISRDEFEAVKAVAATARTEQEALQRRVDALEAQVAALTKRKAD